MWPQRAASTKGGAPRGEGSSDMALRARTQVWILLYTPFSHCSCCISQQRPKPRPQSFWGVLTRLVFLQPRPQCS